MKQAQDIIIREIDKKHVWESFLDTQQFTSHFQSWNWVAFERSLGGVFETFGMYRKDKLVGLLPVKHIHAKRGHYLQLRRGPIFDFDREDLWVSFFSFIKKKAQKEGYWFVRVSPLILQDRELQYADIFSRLQECPMHDVDGEITWVLDLSQTEEQILQNMRKNTRYYIRRAERDGVKIFKTQDSKYLDDFWEIYADTVKRQQWSAYSKEYLKKEFSSFVEDDQIELYLAKYKEKYIAGSMIVYYKNQAIYHHSGTLSEYSKVPASYLIQWEAIREAKRRGLEWYNFFGVSPLVMEGGEFKAQSGHPWEGLTFFKLGFGGQVQQFIHAKDFPVSSLYKLTRIYEKLERWKRGY